MEKWIVKKLIGKANDIAKLYQEIKDDGKTNENMRRLLTLLEEEKSIYQLIPFPEYENYIRFLSTENDFDSLLDFMNLDFYFLPQARIVHKLYYFCEKRAMFFESLKYEEKDQYQYLFDYELFSNLVRFYAIYLNEKHEFTSYLTLSFLNVVYHFSYAEELFLKMNSSYRFYNKKQLQRFSGLPNIADDLDAEFSQSIQEFMDIIIEDDALPFSDDEPITKQSFYIYISTLYLSIENIQYVHDLLAYYKASNHPDLSFSTRNFLDEIQILVQNSEILRRSLK